MATVEKSLRRIAQFVPVTLSAKSERAVLLGALLEMLLVEPRQELEKMSVQRVRKRPHQTTIAPGTTSTIVVAVVHVVVHGVHVPPVVVTASTRSTKQKNEERVLVLPLC